MERAVANAHRSKEQAVIAALKIVYFMAKKNLASDIFSDLKEFLTVQVRLLKCIAIVLTPLFSNVAM